jgi:hypothetical protein
MMASSVFRIVRLFLRRRRLAALGEGLEHEGGLLALVENEPGRGPALARVQRHLAGKGEGETFSLEYGAVLLDQPSGAMVVQDSGAAVARLLGRVSSDFTTNRR